MGKSAAHSHPLAQRALKNSLKTARLDYRHSFARRHNADPSTEGLADQQREWKIREDDWRREAQERARQHEFWATKARNLSAWAPKGMG